MSCFVHTYDECHVLSIDMMNVMFCPYIWWMPYWVHTYDEYHVLSMHMMNTMFCLYVWRMAYFVHVYDKCHVLSIHMMNAMFCPYIWWMPCFVHTYDESYFVHTYEHVLSTHKNMLCLHIWACFVLSVTVQGLKQSMPSPSNSQPSSRSRHTSGLSDNSFYPGSSSGGLSVTGCMSDFSLYIFHPYGTGVQRRMQGQADSPAFRGHGALGTMMFFCFEFRYLVTRLDYFVIVNLAVVSSHWMSAVANLLTTSTPHFLGVLRYVFILACHFMLSANV